MKRKPLVTWFPFRFALLISPLIAAWPQRAQAQNLWWDNAGTGTRSDWGNLENWSTVVGGGTTPGALPANVVTFNASSLTAAQTISLGAADRTITGIIMSNATNGVTIQGTGTANRTLNIGANGISKTGTGAITIGNTAANTNANVRLTADQTWTNSNNTGAITIQNTVTASSAVARKLTLGGTSTAANIINGVISNNGTGVFSLDKSGTGLWVLAGANTFTGAVNVTGGTLRAGNAAAFGNAAGGVSITAGAVVDLNGQAIGAEAFTLNGDGISSGGALINASNNAASLSGTVNLASASSIGTTGLLTLSGAISGTAALTKVGTGVLSLSGTNTYNGGSTISAGTLSFFNTNAKSASGTHAFAAGTTLGLGVSGASAFTSTDLDNAFAGSMTGNLSGITITPTTNIGIDTTNGNFTYASVVPATTTSGLIKLGGNTLTLSGANTYTTPTSILAGTLSAASLNSVDVLVRTTSSSLGAPTTAANGTISLGLAGSTGTLAYTGAGETTDRVINLAGTTGGGGILNNGAGTLTISSPLTFTGTGAKALSLGGTGNITFGSAAIPGGIAGSSAPLTIAKSGANTVTLAGANTATTLNISGGILDTGAGSLTLSNTSAATVAASGNATINGNIILTGVTTAGNGVDFGATAAGVTLTVNAVISGADTTDIDFWSAPAGTTILAGANTYLGQSNIAGQIVQVTSLNSVVGGTASSSLGAPITAAKGTISFGNAALAAGTLRYTGTGETTDRILNLQGTTSGGTIEQAGTGLLKFTSANTATGNGVKALTLSGSTAGTGEISGAIVNSTATTGITKTGTGQWTLSGVNTYTGPTNVNGGNLVLSQGGGTGVLDNTTITINNGGTLSPLNGFAAGNTGAGTLGARLILNAGGTLNLADGTIGNFTINQQAGFLAANVGTFAGGAINLDLSSTAADLISFPGTVGTVLSSGANAISINPVSLSLTPGNYTLINSAAAGSTLSNANFYLASPNLNVGGTLYNLSLSGTSGTQVLTVGTLGPVLAPNSAFWNGTTNASWATQPGGSGTATNWSASSNGTPDTFALPASPTNVLFTSNTAANLSTTLDQAFTINSLTYTASVGGLGSSIASGTGSNALTINAAALSGNAAGNGINVLAGSGAHTISADVVLGASQTWTNSSTNPLSFSGNITGPALTLTTAGTGAIQIGNGGTSGSIATDVALVTNGQLAFNRSDTVTQGSHFASAISGTGGVTQSGSGTLVLSGTNTHTGNTTVTNGTLNISGTGSITGNTTSTRLALQPTVSGTSAIVNYSSSETSTFFAVNGANLAGTASVLNQSAGTIQISPNVTTDTQSVVQATGAYGAYNISGGTFRDTTGVSGGSRFTVTNGGTASATNGTIDGVRVGMVNVSGTGFIDHRNAEWWLNYSLGQINVTDSGKIDHTGSNQPFAIFMDTTVVGGSYGVLNVAGTGAQVLTGTQSLRFGNSTANGSGNSGLVNLAAGTLSTGTVGTTLLPAAPSVTNGIYYNYAGGTLQATAALPNGWTPASGFSATVINTIYGAIDNSAVTGAPSFTGGLTVDTNGNAVTIPSTQPLLAATGVGVTQTNLTVSGGSGYIGAPSVTFSKPAAADGVPAAGYALMSGGAVTGIVITSPGVYASGETPTVNLLGGFAAGAGTAATVTATPLATANTAGGLTKIGVGTLTINGPVSGSTNLNGGNVTVSEGILNAGFTPAGVGGINVANGATLNLYDGVTTTMGINALTLAGGSSLGFDLNAPGANDILNLTGTATISSGVSLNFNNLGGLATGNYNLLNVSAGSLNAANYSLGLAPSGFNYIFSTTNANQTLRLTTSPLSLVYWQGDVDGSWGTLAGLNTNWSNVSTGATDLGALPAATDTLVFSADNAPMTATAIATTLDGDRIADSLRFTASPAGITSVTIAQGTSGSLTLTPFGSNNGIAVAANAGAISITAPVITGAAQTWEVVGGGVNGSSLSVGGNVTFTNAVTKSGGGGLSLSGSNSGAGGLTLAGGTLNLNSTTALGTGNFTIGAGTTIDAFTAPIVNAGNNSQDWNGNFTFTGTNSLNLGSGAVTLGANVQLTTSTTTANTLTVGGIIGDGASSYNLTKAGAGTLLLGGANTYDGATSITGGVLRITNGSALGSTTAGTTVASGTTLEIDGTGGAVTVGAEALTINGGGVAAPVANLGALRNIAGNNTYGGTITLAGQSRINSDSDTLILNHATAVTAANQNLVVGGAGNVTIAGAITTGTGGIIKSGGTGTLTLSGLSATAAGNYSGATTLNEGTVAITHATTAALTGGLNFGEVAGNTTVSTLDLTGGSATFTGAALVRTNSASVNTITIGAAKTLTLDGGLTVGYAATAGAATDTRLKLTGSNGSMAVNGTNLIVGVAGTGTQNDGWFNRAVLDVSELASFTTNVTNFNLGVGNTVNPTGSVLLSNTANTILATTLNVAENGGQNGKGTSTLTLGTGTNVIQADNILIGIGKSSGPGMVTFASQAPSSPGTVTIANKAGTGAANITVANVNGVGTGNGAVGTLDLRGHIATVNAGTLLISQANNTVNTNASGTNGTVRFDAGTFTVATLNMGLKTGASTGTATALLAVGGGNFTVNTAFTLGSQATGGASLATLDLTGGTFTSNPAITQGGGATTSTINLDGGTLDMTNDAIGTAANLIILNAKQGTLKNLSELNGGGALAKTTAGTLVLDGTNTYTGPTNVNVGTLLINGNNSAATGAINVAAGATLGGSGTLGGPLNFTDGTFAPGNSPGTMTTSGPVTFGTASVLNYELNGANTTVGSNINDLLTGVTNLTLGGTLNVTEIGLNSFQSASLGAMWRIMDYTGTLTGTLALGTTPALADPGWSLVVDTSTNQQVNLQVVPETSAVSLLGLATLFTLRRRRKVA